MAGDGSTSIDSLLGETSDAEPSWLRQWKRRAAIGAIAGLLMLAGGAAFVVLHATRDPLEAAPTTTLSDDDACRELLLEQGIDPDDPGVTFSCTIERSPNPFPQRPPKDTRKINRIAPFLFIGGGIAVLYSIALIARYRRWAPVAIRETWRPVEVGYHSSRQKQATVFTFTPEGGQRRLVGLDGAAVWRLKVLKDATHGEAISDGDGRWLVRIPEDANPFIMFEPRSDRQLKQWESR